MRLAEKLLAALIFYNQTTIIDLAENPDIFG
jgi:hypothetical protein